MKIRTQVKSGRLAVNHNQSRKLVTRLGVKSGGSRTSNRNPSRG